MRVVLQRVKEANVTVDGNIVGQIESGLMLLVAFSEPDQECDLRYLAEKIVHLRIFEDSRGKMNHSLLDVGGSILSISQFTLYADCGKGRRPSFTFSAKASVAQPLYNQFNELLREYGVVVQTGIFGADMQVHLLNDGPVTMILDS